MPRERTEIGGLLWQASRRGIGVNRENKTFDLRDPELVGVLDDLSLWSAMAGQLLLEHVPLRPGIRALDIACGTGFPMLELA